MSKSFIYKLFLFLLLALLLKCQKQISPNQPINQNENAGNKLAKKPAQAELVANFQIFDENAPGEPVVKIKDGIVIEDNGILDFTTNTYTIEYDITSDPDQNEQIEFVRFFMAYVENSDVDNSDEILKNPPSQKNYWVFQHEVENWTEPLWKVSGEIAGWNGKVTQHEADYEYEKYTDHELTLYDQKATHPENEIPDFDKKSDHYFCYLWSEGTGRFTQAVSIPFGLWIIAEEPEHVYYVGKIDMNGSSSTGKTVIPQAQISLENDEGYEEIDTDDIYLFGRWDISSELYVARGTISENNIITFTVDGPEIRPNIKDKVRFTVYAIRTAYGAYNPYLNSSSNLKWIWPGVPAYGEF